MKGTTMRKTTLDVGAMVLSILIVGFAIVNEIADKPIWAIANITCAIWIVVFRLLSRQEN